MTDFRRLQENHALSAPQHRVECPVWHRPHLTFVADGIAWKCHSCKRTTHLTTWTEVDRAREEIGQAREAKEGSDG